MKGLWCKKIGMTQVFQQNGTLVPVTVLDVGKWIVTQIKTVARDGYAAVQIGCVHDAHSASPFSESWLKAKQEYFSCIREVPVEAAVEIAVGSLVDPAAVLQDNGHVDVSGATIGRGFQGGVKRHGFKGGRGSHGDKLGRQPGSMGYMRSRGRVIKGWRMAGHMGCELRTVRGLQVISVDTANRAVLVKGSVPGKTGSLLFVCRQSTGE